jgi:HEAT repeat protein
MTTAKRPLACLTLGLLVACSLAACGRPAPRPSWPPPDEIAEAQISNLGSPDWTVRRCAANTLGLVGPQVVDATLLARVVSALENALQDHEPSVREAAQKALDLIQAPVTKRRFKDAGRS